MSHDRKALADLMLSSVYKTEEIRGISRAGSGKERSFVFDFKRVALDPTFLTLWSSLFWEEHPASGLQIGGMESGALPLLSALALSPQAHTPARYFFIRKSRKKHDLARQIEGVLDPATPCILVDDILNTGETILRQVTALEARGFRVTEVFVIVRFRDLSYYRALNEKGIRITSLFELNDFVHHTGIHNLTTPPPLPETYRVVSKIVLTDKPNLYVMTSKSAPRLEGDLLYVGNDEGVMTCLNTATGEPVWSFTIAFTTDGKGIYSSPAIYRDRVMFGAYDGNIYCLNRFTGEKIWVNREADWVGSSPGIDEKRGVVYVGLEFGLWKKRGGLIALDISSGKPQWVYREIDGLVHASPAYHPRHDLVVCGSNDGHIYAFHASSGVLAWAYRADGEIKAGVAFTPDGEHLACGTLEGTVHMLSARDGAPVARFSARDGIYATPLIDHDHLYIGSLDKHVYCFDLSTQTIAWEFETTGRILDSLCLSGESLFVGANNGAVYELDTHTGNLRGRFFLPERVVNAPVVTRGTDDRRTLFVPTFGGELYKVEEIPQVE